MTPIAKDYLSINLKDNPALAEMLKGKQPGDKLDFELTDGTTMIKGMFCIDELLPDFVNGKLCDIEVEGGDDDKKEDADEDEESYEEGYEDESKDKIGRSVMAVMSKKKK